MDILGIVVLSATALASSECQVCIHDARVQAAEISRNGRLEISLAPVRSARGGRVSPAVLSVSGFSAAGEPVSEARIRLRRNQRFVVLAAPDQAEQWVIDLN